MVSTDSENAIYDDLENKPRESRFVVTTEAPGEQGVYYLHIMRSKYSMGVLRFEVQADKK